MQKKVCKQCDINNVKRVGKIYCSKACYHKSRLGDNNNKWKGGQTEKSCNICNNTFFVDKYRSNTAKYCSRKCLDAYKKTPEARLLQSEKARKQILEQYGETPKFITKLQSLIRESAKYRLWRQQVWERDGYTCQLCFKRGKICADHIISFLELLLENKIDGYDKAMESNKLWNIENGRTLCYDCHYKTDNYGFKAIKNITN